MKHVLPDCWSREPHGCCGNLHGVWVRFSKCSFSFHNIMPLGKITRQMQACARVYVCIVSLLISKRVDGGFGDGGVSVGLAAACGRRGGRYFALGLVESLFALYQIHLLACIAALQHVSIARPKHVCSHFSSDNSSTPPSISTAKQGDRVESCLW